MKRFMGKGLFLAGMLIIFSQISMATGGGRTDLEGPGDAEVIAGTGYQHTLFDSAEKKCQNCHNDLYDTWKTSMHAKSWKDPIFQSKYQDFLRLQASKIGAKGPTVVESNMQVIRGGLEATLKVDYDQTAFRETELLVEVQKGPGVEVSASMVKATRNAASCGMFDGDYYKEIFTDRFKDGSIGSGAGRGSRDEQ